MRQKNTEVLPLDRGSAIQIGRLLAATRTSDVVDAQVVLCAGVANNTIVTSDPQDLRRLNPRAQLIVVAWTSPGPVDSAGPAESTFMNSKRPSGPVPAPEALPGPVVDNHTHLDHLPGMPEGVHPSAEQVAALIDAAAAVNVPRMVQIGCDLAAARWTVQAVDVHPQLLGGVALHPTEATKHAAAKELDAAFAEIEALAEHPRIRVVGETGLDHYWVDDEPGRAAQEDSFRRHIDLAKRLGKVLQIHDRDAHDDVLRILKAEGAPEKTVFHCFSGNAEMARFCADQGWYLSFAGPLTFKNAADLREALLSVSLDRVLVETDAPYLTPMPHRGRPNASYLMPWTVRGIATVTQRDVSEICSALFTNSQELYGSW